MRSDIRTVKVTREECDALYKMAFSRMLEKSAKTDPAKPAAPAASAATAAPTANSAPAAAGQPSKGKDALIGALVGTLLGGGLGMVNNAITPRDKDESRAKRFWRHLLGGMALGGVAGAGINYLGLPKATANAVKDIASGTTDNGKGEAENFMGMVGDSAVGRGAAGYGAGYVAGKAAPLAFESTRFGGTGFGAQSRINIKGYDSADNVINLNPAAASDKPLGTYFSAASQDDAKKVLANIKNPNGAWRPVGVLANLTESQVKNMTDAQVQALAQSVGLTPGPGAAITGHSIPPSWFGKHLPAGLARRLGVRTTWKYVTGIDDARTAILKAMPKAKRLSGIAGNLSRTTSAAGFRAGVVKHAPHTLGVIGALVGAITAPSATANGNRVSL